MGGKIMKKKSLLLMVLAIGLASCNINTLNSSSEKPTINSSIEENNKEINYSTSINENSLIGIAAYYEFDNKTVNNISNISIKNKNSDLIDSDYESKEEEYLKISYPYDYVKIISAYKFNIYVDDIEDQVAKEIIKNIILIIIIIKEQKQAAKKNVLNYQAPHNLRYSQSSVLKFCKARTNSSTASFIEQCNSPPEAFLCPPPLKYFAATALQGKSSTLRSETFIFPGCSSRKKQENLMPFICKGIFTSPSVSPFTA